MSKNDSNRRDAIKKIAGAGMITGVWSAPVVQSVVLPAHAQTSIILSGTFSLSGAQEVPAVTTIASGNGLWTLDGNNEFVVSVGHDVASPTAAHIHAGAAGSNGAVEFAFSSATTPLLLSVIITDAQVAILKADGFYVNIHSTAVASGELRGQITV